MPVTKTVGRLIGTDEIALRYTSTPDIGSGGRVVRYSVSRNLVSSVTYGDNLPDWRQRIRRRQSATTPLSGVVYRRRSAQFGASSELEKVTAGFKSYLFNRLDGPGVALVPNPDSNLVGVTTDKAVNLAKMAFVKKAVDAQRAFQSGVFLGELREAIHLIRRPASALRQETGRFINSWSARARKIRASKGLKNLPATHPKVVGSLRKAAAGSWLEFSFGVQPLVNDVRDAAEAAKRTRWSYNPSKVVRGVGKYQAGRSLIKVGGDTDCFRISGVVEVSTEVEAYFIGCVSTYDEYSPSPTLGQLGVSWRQVLPTVWELIPYSFLIDYFTNVGDLVEAIAFNRASVRWIEQGTVKRRKNSLCEPLGVSVGSYNSTYKLKSWHASLGSQGTWVDVREFGRSNFLGSLVPSLAFEIPGNKSRKWLNIGALVFARGSQVPIRR